ISKNLADYIKPYYICANNFLNSASFLPLAATCLLIVNRYPISSAHAHIFAISIAFFVLHLLVFPSYHTRFFMCSIGITSLILIEQASRHLVSKSSVAIQK